MGWCGIEIIMKRVLVGLILFLVVAATLFGLLQLKFGKKKFSETTKIKPSHTANFMDSKSYAHLLSPESEQPIVQKVYGGVVSHHFFAEKEISNFFLKLKNQKVSNVVLIGPNHFHWGNNSMLTSKQEFQTPWGLLEPNIEIVNKLTATGEIFVEEQPFETEHSIASLVGFIKYVFPNAKFVPIIIMRDVKEESSKNLAEALLKILPSDSLVLASVDFSHHFNLTKTQANDKKSLSAMESFDYESLYESQIDSPQSLSVLLHYVESKDARGVEIKNTNSALLSNYLDSNDITSYFFMHYFKK